MSWNVIWRGDNLARYILIHPNTNILYLSTGIFDREAANSDWKAKFAGGEGVLKSIDGGENWSSINNGLDNLYIGTLAMHPSNPEILLAGAGNHSYDEGSGIYLSTNGGKTWEPVAGKGHVISAVGFSHSSPFIGYAAGEIAFYSSMPNNFEIWENYYNEDIGYSWGPKGIKSGIPIDIEIVSFISVSGAVLLGRGMASCSCVIWLAGNHFINAASN